MIMTVYRYRVWDYQHDDCAYIPPHYATREYIQQLEGTTIIKYLVGTDGRVIESCGHFMNIVVAVEAGEVT